MTFFEYVVSFLEYFGFLGRTLIALVLAVLLLPLYLGLMGMGVAGAFGAARVLWFVGRLRKWSEAAAAEMDR